ncbi:hypothetical protein BDV3_000927 [Batrachochytrium dendrobatidis]
MSNSDHSNRKKSMLVNGISTAHQSDVADDDVVMTDCDSVKPAVSAENIKSAANELFKACVNQAIRNAKHLLALSKRKDYYKILGCSRDATDSEIKKVYRKLALQYHPDKQVGLLDEERTQAENKFKEIGEAYAVLSDHQKKRRFDAGMDVDGSSASDGHGGGFGHSASMDDLLARFATSSGGFSGGRGHQHSYSSYGGQSSSAHGFHFG